MFNFIFFQKLKDNWLYYSLAFLMLFLPFQFALSPVNGIDLAIIRLLIIVIFVAYFARDFKYTDLNLKKDLISKLILFLLLLAAFSLSYTQNLQWSLRKLVFLFSIFPIYLIALKIFQNKDNRRHILISLVMGSAVLSFLALGQFLMQFFIGIDNVYDFLAHYIAPFFLGKTFSQAVLAYPSWLVASEGKTYLRAVATFPDPHMLSYYLGLSLGWSIALASTSKTKANYFWFSALLILLADIATFTRGGYIALIVSAIVILPLVNKKAMVKIGCLVIIIGSLFLLAPHNPVAGRLTSSFDAQEGSNQARLSNFEQAALIIKQHPLGVGIGMYSHAVDPSATYRTPIYAHNLYLDIAAELGLFTALIFILILFFSFLVYWKASKRNNFYIAGVFSITLFTVHSLVETPLYSVHILPIFFLIVALAATIKKNEESNA